MGQVPPAFARLQPVYRRHPLRRRHSPKDHCGTDGGEELRARQSHHRSRPGRFYGDQKTRGLLLMISAEQTELEIPVSSPVDETDARIEQQLEAERGKDLLRFSTAGSVDDGKSTLIGRLLYDSRNVYDDHVRAETHNPAIDFAQLTDGLRAEREQGITIDVAYRYFSTAKRKFIIADTPGHEQYTRNMATGASTADVAIVLVDARKGILTQSRRHAYIAALLGIPRVVAAINKMDLVDYSEEVFWKLSDDFAALAERVGLRSVEAIPVSALEGDNVVHRSE